MAGFLLTLSWLLVLSIAPFVLVEVAVGGYRWLRMTTLFLAGLSAVAGVLWGLFGSPGHYPGPGKRPVHYQSPAWQQRSKTFTF